MDTYSPDKQFIVKTVYNTGFTNSTPKWFATFEEAAAYVAKWHNGTRDYVIFRVTPVLDTREQADKPPRFEVITTVDNKYAVQDTLNGQFVRFGFNRPPLYVEPGKPATEWNNWYSARDFAKRLEALQK